MLCCCSSGVFRISTAVILNGTNVSSSDASPHYGAADPNEDYVFLIYNLGTRGSSTKVQITANTAAGGLFPYQDISYKILSAFEI